MRARLTIVTILLSTLATAQGFAPRIVVAESVLDFGEIEKGETTTLVFEFRNEGQAPLEILEVQAACGCTTVEIEKNVYQAGEAGKIPVVFDSKRFLGPIAKRITIVTNDPNTPKTVAMVKGNVFVEIMTEPAKLMIGKARINQSTSASITVSTRRLPRLEISDLSVSREFLSASSERLGDQSIRITVTADGANFPAEKATIAGQLRFKTNSLTQPEITSPISIRVERPIKVSPTAVYFFASKKGQARQNRIRLVSSGGEFTIREIDTGLSFVEARVEKEDSASKTLEITLLAAAPAGKFEGQVVVKTSLADQPEIIIPIRGSVLE